MKTLQDLYDEARGDEALKASFVEAMRAGAAVDFLKRHDCEATMEELREFLEAKASERDPLELSGDELADVAGGTSYYCGEPCSDSDRCSGTCIDDCC